MFDLLARSKYPPTPPLPCVSTSLPEKSRSGYNKPLEVHNARGMPNDPELAVFVNRFVILEERYQHAIPPRPFKTLKIIMRNGRVADTISGVQVGNTFVAVKPPAAPGSKTH